MMIRGLKELLGYKILARDGEIGKAEDFYFDDQSWFIRYLLVNTGTWLLERTVLVATPAIETPDRKSEQLPVNLTKAQVEQSPDKEWQRSISRQHELELHRFYNWAPYWTAGVGGSFAPPIGLPPALEDAAPVEPVHDPDTLTHFGSMKDALDYSVLASDGEAGSVDNFLGEEEKWQIRYLVFHTRKFLNNRKHLLPIEIIQEINWLDGAVRVDMSEERIHNSPEYDSSIPLDPEFEARVRDYYHAPVAQR